ncbi:MAG: hypothetical protein LLF96_09315 [Eubacteriales bacterium]|nr:hypothetical protein [Eubacteriales bacterium]
MTDAFRPTGSEAFPFAAVTHSAAAAPKGDDSAGFYGMLQQACRRASVLSARLPVTLRIPRPETISQEGRTAMPACGLHPSEEVATP